ncbi:hypothetical protein LAZ67_2004396 [Cordylochernes scorpioides]|uniref:G-protein coupled receptors family 3 profile domain-containing protein n=1 Tax=Cordylochernes scorpioides TaxID=51811 RepID=A0ABY6K751_9ARAC|nr:hypothetical protein LAZ67_2004396 [Cordylochernes scorpioides]
MELEAENATRITPPFALLHLREEWWAVPLAIFSALDIFLICCFEMFVLYKAYGTTPSRRHLFLGQMLLLGLFITSCTGLGHAAGLGTAVLFATGLGHALVFSTLLVKSVFLVSLKSGVYLPPGYQGLLLFFAVLGQVAIGFQALLQGKSLVLSEAAPLCYSGFLLVLLAGISLRVKKLRENHREGRYIAAAAFLSLPLWGTAGLMAGVRAAPLDACLGFGSTVTALLTFLVMFLPKGRQLAAMGREGLYPEDREYQSIYTPSFLHVKPHSKPCYTSSSAGQSLTCAASPARHVEEDFWAGKIWNASRFCVSSLHRGHAILLCILPIVVTKETSSVPSKPNACRNGNLMLHTTGTEQEGQVPGRAAEVKQRSQVSGRCDVGDIKQHTLVVVVAHSSFGVGSGGRSFVCAMKVGSFARLLEGPVIVSAPHDHRPATRKLDQALENARGMYRYWGILVECTVSHISEFPVHGYRSGSGLTTPYYRAVPYLCCFSRPPRKEGLLGRHTFVYILYVLNKGPVAVHVPSCTPKPEAAAVSPIPLFWHNQSIQLALGRADGPGPARNWSADAMDSVSKIKESGERKTKPQYLRKQGSMPKNMECCATAQEDSSPDHKTLASVFIIDSWRNRCAFPTEPSLRNMESPFKSLQPPTAVREIFWHKQEKGLLAVHTICCVNSRQSPVPLAEKKRQEKGSGG